MYMQCIHIYIYIYTLAKTKRSPSRPGAYARSHDHFAQRCNARQKLPGWDPLEREARELTFCGVIMSCAANATFQWYGASE